MAKAKKLSPIKTLLAKKSLARQVLAKPDRPLSHVQHEINRQLAALEKLRALVTAKEREINVLLMELSKLHLKTRHGTLKVARKKRG